MNTYKIYHHRHEGTQVVKQGVSWPGLLFSGFWLLLRQLWTASVIWWSLFIGAGVAIKWAISQSPEYASMTAQSLALFRITLTFLPFLFGNSWIAHALENNGYTLLGLQEARSSTEALEQFTAQRSVQTDRREDAAPV